MKAARTKGSKGSTGSKQKQVRLTATPRPAPKRGFLMNGVVVPFANAEPLEREPVKLKGGVVAQDFNWGVNFTGTKEQLIRAHLVPANFKGVRDGEEKLYWLPLNHKAGYDDACYRGRCPIPQRWDASVGRSFTEDGLFTVKVEFDVLIDMNVQERANQALEALKRGGRDAIEFVKQIPPVPLSVAVPALIEDHNKKYGKPGKGARHD